jgi:hypothetical protein
MTHSERAHCDSENFVAQSGDETTIEDRQSALSPSWIPQQPM